jgi:hypothetical protein
MIRRIGEICISHVIEIHFGKNPRNGGKPPSESRLIMIRLELNLLKFKCEK